MTNLMIVEDNQHILNSYKNYFSTNENLKVTFAQDGANALKLYEQNRFDIILLDLRLPKINGIEVIDKISELENDIKKGNIIVVSGNHSLRHKLLNTKKVYKVIPKPFKMTNIVDTINELTNEYSDEFPMNKLNQLLLKLNLKTHSKSCSHLIEVIRFSYQQPYMLENINKIYTIIANRYNCSFETIKSSVRSSIRTVNKSMNRDLLTSIFFIDGKDYNKMITPKYFVNCIIDYLTEDNTHSLKS